MWFQIWTSFAVALDLTIVLGVTLRVIMRRPPAGVALAWMVLVAFLPFIGFFLYMLIGERRVGMRRARRIASIRSGYGKLAARVIDDGLTRVAWEKHRPEAHGMDCLATRLVGIPTVTGSSARFFSDSQEILRAIAANVDTAQKSVLMEFYIWNEGGAADEVLESLVRAARRGVSCRLLVDAVGARPWWRGTQPRRLREAGVQLRPALPVSLMTAIFSRTISAYTAKSS